MSIDRLVGPKSTYSGRESIPTALRGDYAKLVGQTTPLFTDDYMHALRAEYPLDEVLGNRLPGIAVGNWTDLNHFSMDSPMQCTEDEQILNGILYNSARAGQWQAAVKQFSRVEMGHIVDIAKFGFVYFVTGAGFGSKTAVAPTQAFLEHCIVKNMNVTFGFFSTDRERKEYETGTLFSEGATVTHAFYGRWPVPGLSQPPLGLNVTIQLDSFGHAGLTFTKGEEMGIMAKAVGTSKAERMIGERVLAYSGGSRLVAIGPHPENKNRLF